MEAFFSNILFFLCGRILSVKKNIPPNGNCTRIRTLQKIQAPQQSSFAAAGGSDQRQRFALRHGKADISEYFCTPEMFFNMPDIQNAGNICRSALRPVLMHYSPASFNPNVFLKIYSALLHFSMFVL